MKNFSLTRLFQKTIAVRLGLGYAVLLLALLLMFAMAQISLQALRKNYDAVLDESLPRLAELQKIQNILTGLNLSARDALLATDPGEVGRIVDKIQSERGQIGDMLETLQASLAEHPDPSVVEMSTKIGESTSSVLVGLLKFSRFAKASRTDMALNALNKEVTPQIMGMVEKVRQFEGMQMGAMKAAKDQAAQTEQTLFLQNVALICVALLVALGFGWWTVRTVLYPLRQVTHTADYMADGDFAHTLPAGRHDEVGRVMQAFNNICKRLSVVIVSIREKADEVNVVTETIRERNTRLEADVSRQTQSLNASLQSIENVKELIQRNSATAGQATRMAADMDDVATRSKGAANDAVQEMQAVEASSKKITDIIALIDSIAFQTNILALNAAVEAARAGEHGRGFAVVASEVRNLASRSGAASRDIKALIVASQTRVASGTAQVASISQMIDGVAHAATELKNMVTNITQASSEQQQHMNAIVESMSELLVGNDKNVHLVGQMQFSLEDLEKVSDALTERVNAFQTRDDEPEPEPESEPLTNP